jgi:putative ABC transport system permease protein
VSDSSLSILERRRELGLLRVVGMLDKRVQRMVRLEAIQAT